MSRPEPHRPADPAEPTPDEREWIHRQARSARTLAEEQREVRERLSIAAATRRLRLDTARERRRVED